MSTLPTSLLQVIAVGTLFFVVLTLFFERLIALTTSKIGARNTSSIPTWRWGRGVAKTLASLGFLSYYGVISSSSHTVTHLLPNEAMWIALVASALGDVILLGSRERDFLAGLIAFFIAHLAYIYAFLAPLFNRLSDPNFLMTLGLIGALSAAVNLTVFRIFKPDIKGEMRAPALAYTLVISLMITAAIFHAFTLNSPLLAIGAIAFWLSDLAVAQQQFQGDRLPYGGLYVRYWGLPLYYIAQLTICSHGLRLDWFV